MQTSLPPGKPCSGLGGFFLTDALVGLLILLLLVVGIGQSFQTLGLLVIKQEKALTANWTSEGSDLERAY